MSCTFSLTLSGQDEREQGLEHAALVALATAAARAGDHHLGDDVDLGELDRLGEPLHHVAREQELRAAGSTHLLLDRERLRDADARGLLGRGRGERLDALGLAAGSSRSLPAAFSCRP